MTLLLNNLNPAHSGGDNSHLESRVHHADLEELCQAVGENSVDMILCDLPYG